jgi:hypothetical protein
MPLRQQKLQKYVNLATTILIDVARGNRGDKFITYKELMTEMGGPGRGYIGEVLEEVCCNEYSKNRLLLSAVVIHKTDGLPGEGFWKIRVIPDVIKNASKTVKEAFWHYQCNRVWRYWQKHDS